MMRGSLLTFAVFVLGINAYPLTLGPGFVPTDTVESSAIVDSIRNGADIDIDSAFILGSLEWNDTVISSIDIRYSIFADRLDFSGAVFRSKFVFQNVLTEKSANFAGAQFDSTFIVDLTLFHDSANFKGVYFGRRAWVSSSLFFRAATFENARFKDTTTFRNTTCSTTADFSGARFERLTYFASSKFVGPAYFISTHFAEGGSFPSTRFLGKTDFWLSWLENSSFRKSELSSVEFRNANLNGVYFQPDSIPSAAAIAFAANLEHMYYDDNPSALVRLRAAFRREGFRQAERLITYAIKKSENDLRLTAAVQDTVEKFHLATQSMDSVSQRASLIDRMTNLTWFCANIVLFDWTCGYGLHYGRPLVLIFLLWVVCGGVYGLLSLTRRESNILISIGTNDREDGRQWMPIRNIARSGLDLSSGKKRTQVANWTRYVARIAKYCLLFSALSAVNIGFRDFQFGRWIQQLLPSDIVFRPIKWARSVAGTQAILSVILLALFFLSYFGRPFD